MLYVASMVYFKELSPSPAPPDQLLLSPIPCEDLDCIIPRQEDSEGLLSKTARSGLRTATRCCVLLSEPILANTLTCTLQRILANCLQTCARPS